MAKKTYQQALKSGTCIESFEIVEVLGAGGFGITYKAIDKDLNYEVAIKEYLPNEYACRADGSTVVAKSSELEEDYEFGLERFLDEGRTLAKFKHPNIVRVVRYLRANGTAYLVMDYEYGQTFHEYLQANPSPGEQILSNIAVAILNGLNHIHSHGFLHRDIKPGNIYIRDSGEALLIDFGAARNSIGEHSQSMTGIVTAGYAPFEQYSVRAKQSPACDLYALGATLYRALLGVPPVEAPERIASLHEEESDPMTPAMGLGLTEYSDNFLRAVDWMLNPLAKDRPQSALSVLQNIAPDEMSDEQETVMANPRPSQVKKSVTNYKKRVSASTLAIISVVFVLVIVVGFYLLQPSAPVGDSNLAGVNPLHHAVPPGKNKVSNIGKNVAGHGFLSVISKPAGAKVYIDNAYAGVTPFINKSILSGSHNVRLEKDRYKKYSEKLYVIDRNQTNIDVSLELLTAPLTIRTYPKKATITFADKSIQYKERMKLPLGDYDVVISAPGYISRKMRIPVNWGKTLQGTYFRSTYRISLRHEKVLQKFNFKRYGRISGLRYIPKQKILLLSTFGRNTLYMFSLNPDNTKESDTLPPGARSVSYGSTTKPIELGGKIKAPVYKLITRFYARSASAFALSKDRTRLFVGGNRGKVIIFDLISRKKLAILDHNNDGSVRAIALSNDGKKLAVVIKESLTLWDLGKKQQTLIAPIGKKVSKILFSPDQASMFVYRWYSPFFDRISLNNKSFPLEQRFSGIDLGIYSLILSDNNQYIMAAGRGTNIKLWNARTGVLAKIFEGHTKTVSYIVSHADRLYSGGSDKTLRVWDMKASKQLAILEGHESAISGMDVIDGAVVTGDSSGDVYFWDIKGL